MSFDLKLLALFSERDTYEKYKSFIPKESLATNDTLHMLADYEAFYKAFPSMAKIDWADFRLWGTTIRHSHAKSDALDAWLLRVSAIEKASSGDMDKQILSHFQRKQAAGKIKDLADKISTGDETDFGPIITIVEKYKKEDMVSDDVSKLFGTTDLSAILESRVRSGGLEWRLPSFNRAAGPIHSGDFVMLAARPEAGKTSWLCSEMTHMVKFLDSAKDAVIFNPEEGGGRLFLRLVTAAVGDDIITIASDEKTAMAKYEAEVGRTDRIKVVEPAGGIRTRDIERVLDKGNYGLVAINVLDKIKLPYKYNDSEKEVDKYRSLAYWMREAANKYQVPILSVVQADNMAEGQKWLTQNMLYGSKTGVQGEVDLLIGMGYDRAIEDRRYMALLKNKLPGGTTTDPKLKHAHIEVGFDPLTGRYKDI